MGLTRLAVDVDGLFAEQELAALALQGVCAALGVRVEHTPCGPRPGLQSGGDAGLVMGTFCGAEEGWQVWPQMSISHTQPHVTA